MKSERRKEEDEKEKKTSRLAKKLKLLNLLVTLIDWGIGNHFVWLSENKDAKKDGEQKWKGTQEMATKAVKKELLNDDIKVKLMSCANWKFFYSEIDIRLRNLSVWFFFLFPWLDW